MNNLVLGTAGYGWIAKVHACAIRSLEIMYDDFPYHIELEKVYRRADDGKPNPYNKIVLDFNSILEDKRINVINICTPNSEHYIQAKASLERGKCVYCEKPIGISSEEAFELAQLADSNHIVTQSALMLRFLPAVAAAKEYIASGKLGQIINFKMAMLHKGYLNPNRPISWRLQSKYAGSGALVDLGMHLADLTRFLLGEPTSVECKLHTQFKKRYTDSSCTCLCDADVDEYALISLKLENGAFGTLECSRISSDIDEKTICEIYGTKGSLKISTKSPYYPEIHNHETGETILGYAPVHDPYYSHVMKLYPLQKSTLGYFMDCHMASLYNFFENVHNKSIMFSESPTFIEAAKSQKLIDDALKNSEIV